VDLGGRGSDPFIVGGTAVLPGFSRPGHVVEEERPEFLPDAGALRRAGDDEPAFAPAALPVADPQARHHLVAEKGVELAAEARHAHEGVQGTTTFSSIHRNHSRSILLIIAPATNPATFNIES
jgi:hypothetical protein